MCGETHLLLLSQVKLMNSSYHQEPRAAPGSIRPGTRPTLCKQQAEAAQRAASMQELGWCCPARKRALPSSLLRRATHPVPWGAFSGSHTTVSPRRECPRPGGAGGIFQVKIISVLRIMLLNILCVTTIEKILL